MQIIKVQSTEREQMIDFTVEVEKVLRESGKQEGIINLFVQHTTCGLTVNENADPDVQTDILHALRKLIPQYGLDFRHFEHNSDAHLKAGLMGLSVTIPFTKGQMQLGRWQGIYLCEFDGGRARKIAATVIGQ